MKKSHEFRMKLELIHLISEYSYCKKAYFSELTTLSRLVNHSKFKYDTNELTKIDLIHANNFFKEWLKLYKLNNSIIEYLNKESFSIENFKKLSYYLEQLNFIK